MDADRMRELTTAFVALLAALWVLLAGFGKAVGE